MFLHRVIDPTLQPGPGLWGDYRDERRWRVRDRAESVQVKS